MNNWKKLSILQPLDLQLADLFGQNDLSSVAIALCACVLRQGHSCLDLNQAPVFETLDSWLNNEWPSLETWRKSLEECSAIGTPDNADHPFILDKSGKFYLRRLWRYEQDLIEQLRRIDAQEQGLPTDAHERINAFIARYPELAKGQAEALKRAAKSSLLIISGGPGTGKTTTVLRLLQLLGELHQHDQSFQVALAAPTGKAAQRIQESISQGLKQLGTQIAFPDAVTLHRLLEYRPVTGRFERGPKNPLPHQLIIVDEASMLDLSLMAQLASAVPSGARLLLLGDKDQLASVDAGCVLGDLVDAAEARSEAPERWTPPVCILKDYFRFSTDSGIAALCENIRKGSVDASLQCLENHTQYRDLHWLSFSDESQIDQYLRDHFLPGLKKRLEFDDPNQALKSLREQCLLSPLRRGPFGCDNLNLKICNALSSPSTKRSNGQPIFNGCPVMVSENDYELGLFNGDIGVIMKKPTGDFVVVFPDDSEEGFRSIAYEQLPAHDIAFAITVHKSQGSEFDAAFLILPDRTNPLLTRELIYTGISRARKEATVVAPLAVLKTCIHNKTTRSSGLLDALAELPAIK